MNRIFSFLFLRKEISNFLMRNGMFYKRWLKTKESNYFEWNIRLVNKLINFTRKFIHLCNYSVRIADHLFEIWSNRYNNLFQIETFHSCKHSFLLCTQWYTVRFITSDEINVFLLSIYIYIYIFVVFLLLAIVW